jgi:hypothetical protein
MHETRRGFFMVMAAAASVLAAEDGWVLAQ